MQPFAIQRRAVWRQVILDAVAAAPAPVAISELVEVIGLVPDSGVIRKILKELVAEGRVTERVAIREFFRDSYGKRVGWAGKTAVFAIARSAPAAPNGRRPAKPRAKRAGK